MENLVRVMRSTGEEIELPITRELLQAVQHLIAGAGYDKQGISYDGTELNEMTKAWMLIFHQPSRRNPEEVWDANTAHEGLGGRVQPARCEAQPGMLPGLPGFGG